MAMGLPLLHGARTNRLSQSMFELLNFDYSLDRQAIFCDFGMKNSVVMH
jgi:hypothetical protein